MLWARRLKRQLIDRQGRPGNTQQDVSTWWEMFTSLTSARITSQGRICFKAAVNQTHQNVYHCEFSRQIQTKLQPQTHLHCGYILKKNPTTCQMVRYKNPLWNCCGLKEFSIILSLFPQYAPLFTADVLFFITFFFWIYTIGLPLREQIKKALVSILECIDGTFRRTPNKKSI